MCEVVCSLVEDFFNIVLVVAVTLAVLGYHAVYCHGSIILMALADFRVIFADVCLGNHLCHLGILDYRENVAKDGS